MNGVDVNRLAPAVETAEIMIEAPIETTWNVLTDFAGWPEWNGKVSRMEMHGPVQSGTLFDWVAGGSKIASRLEEVDATRKLAWSGTTFGVRAVHVWKFEKAEKGTRVLTEESFEGFVVRLFPGLMRRALAKALNQGLVALKAEAERRHGRRE